ncbi:MAG: YiiD C-terminal domain-containing protein [Nevskiales bacterium]
MTPAEFTEYLHHNIPLTAALGASVRRMESGVVEITAPLKPNLNHRNTAFGGSLATLGILSGWAVLHLGLRAEDISARIVVQKSDADFIAPGEADLVAISKLDRKRWDRFLKSLRRYKRARIAVDTEIHAGSTRVVAHTGTYVARL